MMGEKERFTELKIDTAMAGMDFADTKWDIIVQGGQSNAQGHGRGPVAEEHIPSPKVFYMEAEKDGCMIDGSVWLNFPDKPYLLKPAEERFINDEWLGDFSLTFAERYEKELLKTGRKILIIRMAEGGTGFIKNHWGVQGVIYQKMVEMTRWALSQNRENRVVAFLWHQGEEDIDKQNKPTVYKSQLQNMLQDFRSHFGKHTPFIAGDLVNEWKNINLQKCQPILDQVKQVLKEEVLTGFVDTAGLLSNNQKLGNGDQVHFCRDALHDLGYRYFDVYKSILFGKREAERE